LSESDLKLFSLIDRWIRKNFKREVPFTGFNESLSGCYRRFPDKVVSELASRAVYGISILEGGDVFVFHPKGHQKAVAIIGSYSFWRNFVYLSRKYFSRPEFISRLTEIKKRITQLHSSWVWLAKSLYKEKLLEKELSPRSAGAYLSLVREIIASDLLVEPEQLLVFKQSLFHIDLEISVTPDGEVLMNHSSMVGEGFNAPPFQAVVYENASQSIFSISSTLRSSEPSETVEVGFQEFFRDEIKSLDSSLDVSVCSSQTFSPSLFAKGSSHASAVLEKDLLSPTRAFCNPEEDKNEELLAQAGLRVIRVPGYLFGLFQEYGVPTLGFCNFMNGVYFNYGADNFVFVTNGSECLAQLMTNDENAYKAFERSFAQITSGAVSKMAVAFLQEGGYLYDLDAGIHCVSYPAVWRGESTTKELASIRFTKISL